MHRIDTPTALPGGVFTEGDPLVPVPATEVSDDWLNAVQEEMAGVIEGAGIDLVKTDNTQLRTAIVAMIAAHVIADSAHPASAVSFSNVAAALRGNPTRVQTAIEALAAMCVTAPLVMYVRPDGNDANSGLQDTSAGAFLTLQGAVDALANRYALIAGAVTIHVAAGTYAPVVVGRPVGSSLSLVFAAGATISGAIPVRISAGVVNINGLSAVTAGGTGLLVDSCAVCNVTGANLSVNGSGTSAIGAMYGGVINIGGGIIITGGYTNSALSASRFGSIVMRSGLSLTLTVGCGNATVSALECGIITNLGASGVAVGGASTGPRFIVGLLSLIYTGGGGGGYFPGSSDGSASSGGVYA